MLITILSFLSITFAESGTIDQSNLFQIFSEADIYQKYELVDSLLASDSIPISFFDKLLSDPGYKESFKSDSSFINFRNSAIRKLLEIPDDEIGSVLQRFYYNGPRARKLVRPITYEMKFDWQRIAASFEDSNGTIWAITSIWWYGCRNDTWLIRQNKGDSTWEGPWFIGSIPGCNLGRNDCGLVLRQDGPHLVSDSLSIDKLISVDELTRDRDQDGLYDIEEERFTTDPDKNDTDNDGLIDGEDLNPLAPPNGELSDEDKIRLTLINAYGSGYPYNIIVVPDAKKRRLEYYGDCSNCIFLALDSLSLAEFEKPCPVRRSGSNLAVIVSVNQITPDSIVASMDSQQFVNAFYFKKKNGVWIIVHREPVLHWD